MYRAITIAREYGSGGGTIAARLAARLGWDLIDNSLITQVAKAANVDPEICHECDERVDSWFHRLNKSTFGMGVFEGVASGDVFDADAMSRLTRKMIVEAAHQGDVVIVGRGAQCILQGRRDVFHGFIYAPMEERIRRVREKYGSAFATPSRIEEQDRLRSQYVEYYYKCDWRDTHLYDALFCSVLGEDTVAAAILTAMGVDTNKDQIQHA
jgi:cytidylate kinase